MTRKPLINPMHTDDSKAKSAESARLAKDPEALLDAKGPKDVSGKARLAMLARLRQMPVSCRQGFVRAMRGKSLRAAVRAYCDMCVGWNRKEALACTDPACPLYPYRRDK